MHRVVCKSRRRFPAGYKGLVCRLWGQNEIWHVIVCKCVAAYWRLVSRLLWVLWTTLTTCFHCVRVFWILLFPVLGFESVRYTWNHLLERSLLICTGGRRNSEIPRHWKLPFLGTDVPKTCPPPSQCTVHCWRNHQRMSMKGVFLRCCTQIVSPPLKVLALQLCHPPPLPVPIHNDQSESHCSESVPYHEKSRN